jgi:hypothetical protein
MTAVSKWKMLHNQAPKRDGFDNDELNRFVYLK